MHIFYVHSNITFLMAKAVIAYKMLARDESLLISGRAFLPQDDGGFSWVNEEPIGVCRPDLRLIHSFKVRYLYDRMIARLTGGKKFHAYVPQTTIPFVELLITTKLCTGFSYIEEGMASYQSSKALANLHSKRRDILSMLQRTAWAGRLGEAKFFDFSKCSEAYCTDARAFQEAPRRIVLTTVFCIHRAVPLVPFENSKSELLCVIDGISIYHPELHEIYLCSLKIALEKLLSKRGFNTLMIKLHPAMKSGQYKGRIHSMILEQARGVLPVKFLSASADLENLIMTHAPVVLLTLCSSVGLYARLWNCEVYTFFPIFRRELDGRVDSERILGYVEALIKDWESISCE